MQEMDVHALTQNLFEKLNKRWMLLAADDGVHENAMTAGWGGLGVLWERDVFFCFVRPTRYTYELLERTDTITLSFFGDTYRSELKYLGTASGRDENKLETCGLSPVRDGKLLYFKEATFVLSGTIIAKNDLAPQGFIDPAIAAFYPKKDYHRMYVCEMSRAFSQ